MNSYTFSVLFVVFLGMTVSLQFWLSSRQLRHVARHRAAVPAEFVEKISLEAHQKAADYTSAKTRLGMWNTRFETILLLIFTLGGGIQWLSYFWQATFTSYLAQGMMVIVSMLLISTVLEMPFGWYRTFVIEARFGFNKMTLALYLADTAKGLVLGAALGLPLLFGVLWLMERMGGYWWLYVWLVWVSFSLLILFIYPSFIAPLFNKFTPMDESPARQRVEALLARCGFKSAGLCVMDGSKRSGHGTPP